MNRILISIGCDHYQNVAPLFSAELDARNIFGELCSTDRYDYAIESSKLILSPKLQDINSALIHLYQAKPEDVTIYFAGHSESRDGRLYLKTIDTQDEALPVTSLSFGDLVDRVSQIPTIQRLNIILDSCNSGGIGSDLASILGDRIRSGVGNVSISILAAAGASRAAKATQNGGHLTVELTKILRGETTAQRWSPFLELSQVADFIKNSPAVKAQEPSYWGMNIRGPNPLARNPSYDPVLGASVLPETFFGSDIRLSPNQLKNVRNFTARISSDGYSPDILRPVQACLANLPINEQVAVFSGLSETLRLTDDDDTISPPARIMLLIQALLPLCSDRSAQQILSHHTKQIIPTLKTKLLKLANQLELNPLYLLSDSGSLSQFYYLPLKLSDIMGWIGLCLIHDKSITNDDTQKLRNIVLTISSQYGNNLVCIEDRQAPGILLLHIAAMILGWHDEAEQIVCLYFNDATTCMGRVAREDIKQGEQLRFILERSNPFSDITEITQQPSELIGTILLCGALSGLDDVLDPLLINLDRSSINFFVSRNYLQFSDDRMSEGHNMTLRVGEEFFSMFDLRNFFRLSLEDWTGANDSLALGMNAISLYLGDRTNWSFLFSLLTEKKLEMRCAWRRVTTSDESGERVVLYEKGTP